MYYEPNEIHIELTDKCNAQCPMCARTNINDISKTTEFVKIIEITFDEFKSIVDTTKFKKYIFCGNYGDPLSAKDFLKIVEYVADKNTEIFIHTNASLKTPSYFKRLGNILSINPNNNVFFALDGLEDTHSIYRQNTNFNKIIENAKSYITNTKAKSTWEYLVFKHNEHQIDIAKQKAKELGFKRFVINHTSRFYNLKKDSFIFYENGIKEILEPAKNSPKIILYDNNGIKCLAKNTKNLFLSFDQLIFPCCYIEDSFRKRNDTELNSIIDMNDLEKLDATKYTFTEIIQSDIFKLIEMSWLKNTPETCYKKCALQQSNIRQKIGLQTS
jgi:hypothetical protein